MDESKKVSSEKKKGSSSSSHGDSPEHKKVAITGGGEKKETDCKKFPFFPLPWFIVLPNFRQPGQKERKFLKNNTTKS